MIFFPPTFDLFSHFESAEFSTAKAVSVESEMMKQEKAVVFCYNWDIGRGMDFNILIQHIYLFLSVSICFSGQYIPFCDEDGYYKPSQCHGSLGQCWCVDRYGNEVSGSRTNGAAECGELRTFCHVWFRDAIPFDCQPG